MYNQFKILILLGFICLIKTHQEINLTHLTHSNNTTKNINHFQDNLNNYNILPIIICLYFINI